MRGLTLMEVIISLAIVSFLIGGIALFASMDDRYLRERDEDELLVSLLYRARSQTQSNVCPQESCTGPSSFGIKVLPGGIVLFMGETYGSRLAGRDEIYPRSSARAQSGNDELVFTRGTGFQSQELILHGTREMHLGINEAGGISMRHVQ